MHGALALLYLITATPPRPAPLLPVCITYRFRRPCTTAALNATDVNEESIRRMESRAPSDDMEAVIAKTSAKDLQDNVKAGFLQKRSMYKHEWKSR